LKKEIANKKDDETMDDSLKFFKSVQTKIKSIEPQPSTSKSEVVSSFLNKFSAEKKPLVPAKNSKKSNPSKGTKKKIKSQPDIRQVLSKNDRIFQHVLTESCQEDGVDPEEMQLALAISESLKTLQCEATTSRDDEKDQHFENPFQSGKIQSISSVLERYGFKSKKVYTEYELEMITNEKANKRSKYKKVPTLLTRTSNEERKRLNDLRLDEILAYNMPSEEEDNGESYEYKVFSYYLQEMHETMNTVFQINCASEPTNEIILKYYVTDLFEPSYTRADHLLRDWNSIPGRDKSPVKEIVEHENANFSSDNDLKIDEEEIVRDDVSIASSCSDIFAGLESFEEHNENDLSIKLSTLQEKLTQTKMEKQLTTKDVEMDRKSEQKNDSMLDLIQKELNEMDNTNIMDLTQNSSSSNDTIEYFSSKTNIIECNESINNENVIKDDKKRSIEEINLLSSDDEDNSQQKLSPNKECQDNSFDENVCDLTQVDSDEKLEAFQSQNSINNSQPDYVCDLTQVNSDEKLEAFQSQNSTNNSQPDSVCDLTQSHMREDKIFDSQYSTSECEIIELSDEEINYSTYKFNHINSPESQLSTQSIENMNSEEIMEIDNVAEQSYLETLAYNDQNCDIECSVVGLLEKTNNVPTTPFSAVRKSRSKQLINEQGFSDSILEILKKYEDVSEKSSRSFQKVQSESNLATSFTELKTSDAENLQFENDFDSFKENSKKFNESIHQSIENIMSTPVVKKSRKIQEKRTRKSLGVQVDDDYIIDTETYIAEPNYKNMTPVELKQELFKFGIRPLPVKKAIELLEFIYDQLHPKIRIAADEEIDVNDSRRVMNLTDIVTNIGVKDDDDHFVFQPGIVENEEYVLAKSKKSKVNLNFFLL
jgi:hypothetical protein